MFRVEALGAPPARGLHTPQRATGDSRGLGTEGHRPGPIGSLGRVTGAEVVKRIWAGEMVHMSTFKLRGKNTFTDIFALILLR